MKSYWNSLKMKRRKNKVLKFILVGPALFAFIGLMAQQDGQIHGNFQIDAQYYRPDSIIGAKGVPEKILSNAFANLIYTKGNFTAGVRYESYINPMLTFENYEGQGIPYRYAQYATDNLDVTVGSFYEQFGNGLIFRSYEARNLGYDNAMDGVRLKFSPTDGVFIKGVIGKQRFYWDKGPGLLRGDAGVL